MTTLLRDRLAAAQRDLSQRWREGEPRPKTLVISRFGFDGWLDLDAAWAASSIAGLGLCDGLGQGRLGPARMEEVPVLGMEWQAPAGTTVAAQEEALPVWLAAQLGFHSVVHVAAAATLQPAPAPGHIAALRDHLRFGPADPLQGWPVAREGARFPQLKDLYDARLVAQATTACATAPVVAWIRSGPSGATDAELQAMARLGAEVVLEAGSAEAIAARHVGLRFASVCLILDDARQPADPGHMLHHAERAVPVLGQTVAAIVKALDEPQSLPREESA